MPKDLQDLLDYEGKIEQGCLALCRHLARETEGFYQVDGVGFFAADGTLLVREL